MDDSPYYSTLGRGNESQLKVDDANGLLSKWPLFLDNYFVPRGYAIALVDMTGTNHSTGCPTVQGPTDNNAAAEVIDWFKGRRTAHDKDGNLVPAPAWFNGKTGMIGKSYDGALAAATAVTGVDGLTTIVGESGPYDYYDYTRSNGVIQRGGHYVSLARQHGHRRQPARVLQAGARQRSTPTTPTRPATSRRRSGTDRNYVKDAPKVSASVFLTHGMGDENVRIDHFSRFWYALADLGVPRKAWLMQTGHVDPFDNSRTLWVRTVHHWFDYWLEGVAERRHGRAAGDGRDRAGRADRRRRLARSRARSRRSSSSSRAPSSGSRRPPATSRRRRSRTRASQRETAMLATPTTVTANRRVFLTPPLTAAGAALGHAGRAARRLGGQDLDAPRRDPGRLRPGVPARVAHRRRRADAHDVGLLGPGERGRQRLLQGRRRADRHHHDARGGSRRACSTPATGRRAERRPRSSPASATRSASRCCPTTTRSRPGTRSAS